jgi:hypothetical protein
MGRRARRSLSLRTLRLQLVTAPAHRASGQRATSARGAHLARTETPRCHVRTASQYRYALVRLPGGEARREPAKTYSRHLVAFTSDLFAAQAFTGNFRGPVTCNGENYSVNPRNGTTADTSGNSSANRFPVLGVSLCFAVAAAAVAVCAGYVLCRRGRGGTSAASSAVPKSDDVPAVAAAVEGQAAGSEQEPHAMPRVRAQESA